MRSVLATVFVLVPSALAALTSESHPCYPLEYIFARGTIEPKPVGIFVGPAVTQLVKNKLGSDVFVVGLDYPASADTSTSPQAGVVALVDRVRARAVQCPSMKFALSGYSQGASVVHHALQQLGPESSKISSIATFGDGLRWIGFPPTYEGRAFEGCMNQDKLCDGGTSILGHVLYSISGNVRFKAADWIEDKWNNPATIDPTKATTLAALPENGSEVALGFSSDWPPAAWPTAYPDGYKPPQCLQNC